MIKIAIMYIKNLKAKKKEKKMAICFNRILDYQVAMLLYKSVEFLNTFIAKNDGDRLQKQM